jgi:dynein heavy chain
MRVRFQGFVEPVQEAVMKLPAMTVLLHNVVQSSMPPTPLKFHYIFNLRDLSRVSQGVYQADPQLITSAGQVVRLWRNEILRVYEDRLNDDKDKDIVGIQQIPNLVKGNFGKIADEVLANPIVFGDFRDALDILQRSDTPHLEVRLYEDLGSWDFVREVLNKILTEYNETQTKVMSLVLFQDAMAHLMRVHRILRMSGGTPCSSASAEAASSP